MPTPDLRNRPGRPRELGELTTYMKRKKARGSDYVKQKERSPVRHGGRPRGSPNKTTQILKDAILMAADEVGDEEGKEGLLGYLKDKAIRFPVAYMQLLAKVLPLQLTVRNVEDLQGISKSMTAQEALHAYVDTLRGLSEGLRGPKLIDVTPPAGSNGHLKNGS